MSRAGVSSRESICELARRRRSRRMRARLRRARRRRDCVARYRRRRRRAATMLDVVFAVASEVFVPLTVGGGVRGAADFEKLLKSAADKVSVNSAAVADPDIVRACARHFARNALSSRSTPAAAPMPGAPRWEVVTQGGRLATGNRRRRMGAARLRSGGGARFCSPAWIATARSPDSIWN